MVKIVDMTSALQQVREKAPDTADAMKRHKAGNAGFTDKSHLKAKGLIPRADGTKKKSPQYEEESLEEQREALEDQLKNAEKELEELYIKEDKAYVIRFKRIKDKERMVVVFRNQSEADMYADNIKKQGGQVFSNKLEKIPMGYKLVDKK